MKRSYFLGRQPIVDGSARTVAYELLYRSCQSPTASVEDDEEASLRVITNTFARFGVEGVLGNHQGLLNVTAPMLMSDLIVALPPDRIQLEILESTCFDERLVLRCQELREMGYRLLLDDYQLDDPREPFLSLVDAVKLDLPVIPKAELRPMVRDLIHQKLRVLAEKVETQREFERCRQIGCEWFQGFYFTRPRTLTIEDDSDERLALTRLLVKIDAGAETEELADCIEAQPTLALRLLRIANSAHNGSLVPIASIANVVVRMGRQPLRRWVAILLLARFEEDPRRPRFLAALHRARLLELLAERLEACDQPGSAFLAGILDSIALAMERPVESLAEGIDLDPEISSGLFRREGLVGQLLDLTSHLHDRDESWPLPGLDAIGLDPEELMQCEALAYEWVHQVQADLQASAL